MNVFRQKIFKKISSSFTKIRAVRYPTIFVLVLIAVLLAYNLAFLGLIYPNVYLASVAVGSRSPETALLELSAAVSPVDKITLFTNGETFDITLEEMNFEYLYQDSVRRAFDFHRTGNILYDEVARIKSLFNKNQLGLILTLDEAKLKEALQVTAGEVALEPVYPSAKLVDKEIVVEKGAPGKELNIELMRAQIGQSLSFARKEQIPIPIAEVDPTLSENQARDLKERATELIDKTLILNFEFQSFVYKNDNVFKLLDPKGDYHDQEISNLVQKISETINREPQNSVFIFEGGRVQEFTPAKDGIAVDEIALKETIVGNLRTLEATDEPSVAFEIPVVKTSPKVKTEDVNNLGIRELIGRGSSRFVGSITNRIYNINLAASRFKGVLVKPGETFSFNDVLGDVSTLTGYKQAFVIKDGKTVLGDGGGVCQVSTTLFRAILNAGLPIAERRAHSYRVGYYEQDSSPGMDATVYAPTTDLKFVNDTPGHLLIQPVVDLAKASLTFELYGTDDGRIATISKPVVSAVTAPPEDLYIDDPTLAAGVIKQIDYKAWGAKAVFNYKVIRGEEVLTNRSFVSSYRPWQAVYLRGTGPAL